MVIPSTYCRDLKCYGEKIAIFAEYGTVQHILEEFTQEVESKRDLGDRFERLMQAFFYYQDLFD
ncbi:MAG: hypothetical protein ACK4QL_00025 [Pseudanabaenaceae cyanobacterium]